MIAMYEYNQRFSLMPLITGLIQRTVGKIKVSRDEIIQAIISEYYSDDNNNLDCEKIVKEINRFQNGIVIIGGRKFGFTFSYQDQHYQDLLDDIDYHYELVDKYNALLKEKEKLGCQFNKDEELIETELKLEDFDLDILKGELWDYEDEAIDNFIQRLTEYATIFEM